ncbi:MAG TPA: hypothetical protein VF815_39680 [Myxococcaceae bacterium]|jgi:hypothetical protein
MKWCLPVALLLLASGCASDKPARRDKSMDSRVEQLEQRNRELQEELRKKEAQVEQAFVTSTQAENSAGLQGLGCAAVMPAKAASRAAPRSGEIHGKVSLRNRSFRMTANYSQPRTVGNHRVMQGNCQVVSP